jgi:hypothetical protein
MSPRSPRLPGFGGSTVRRRGRNERAVDDLARYLRQLEQADPYIAAQISAARTTGASLDRLEADPDRSEHVVGSVARVHAAILAELRPVHAAGADAFDRLIGELSAPLRDTPAS